MSGRPLARFACDCASCAARREDEWDRFVAAHQDAGDQMRDAFLNPEGVTPVQRLQEYLAATRETGTVAWDDGA